MPSVDPRTRSVRIWDLPTRLFHWLLAVSVVGGFVAVKIGGNAMIWHFRFGYVVLSLLLFRLIWGIVGGRWSRFRSFVRPPAAVVRYLRGERAPGEMHDVGHNPLGALSVLAMLVFLAAQVASGLFADDDTGHTGPLIRFASEAASLRLTHYHKTIGQGALIALVALHLLAIAFYAWRGRNLVRSMIDGDQLLERDVPASVDSAATRTLAALLLAACAGGVAWLAALGG